MYRTSGGASQTIHKHRQLVLPEITIIISSDVEREQLGVERSSYFLNGRRRWMSDFVEAIGREGKERKIGY